MEKFIIELQTNIQGKWQKGYHETIKESDRSDTVNVYVEHITTDKKKAKRFYDIEEAQKFATLFDLNGVQTSKVIPVKN